MMINDTLYIVYTGLSENQSLWNETKKIIIKNHAVNFIYEISQQFPFNSYRPC